MSRYRDTIAEPMVPIIRRDVDPENSMATRMSKVPSIIPSSFLCLLFSFQMTMIMFRATARPTSTHSTTIPPEFRYC